MGPALVLVAVVVVLLERGILCLKDLDLHIEPKVVEKGGRSVLTCKYNLEGAPLWTVKWYRGIHEFYRYTPKEHPNTKNFLVDGISVDLQLSNEHQVVLTDVGFHLSGRFSCEVTTDEQIPATATVYKNMLVVVMPNSSANLITDKNNYDLGDTLRANCTSPPSRPSVTHTFILNNIVVCKKCITKKHPVGELTWSETSLELPLFESQFNNGRLTLKCVAKIGDFYEQDTEITFDNSRDPVPAKVTQSASGRQRTLSPTIYFLRGFIIWCVSKL